MPRPRDIVLTPESARRVAAAVRAVEAMPRGRDVPRTQPRITAPSRYAITTSIITAADPSVRKLGSGTGQLQVIAATRSAAGGGTSAASVTFGLNLFPPFALSPAAASTGTFTTDYTYAPIPGIPDVVLLNGGPEIAAGRLVQVKVIDGFFNIDVDYCS